jgi:hypothetical protein
MSIQGEQEKELFDLKRKVYQTYIIAFRRTRKSRLRAKLLNFLGIAIPLVGGGIIIVFYANKTVPDWVLLIF